jgi:very-short-patch-repair endonuclease
VPTESALENRVCRLIQKGRLPPPERQQRIREGGKVLARFDLSYPRARLVIEVDGYEYHSGRRAWLKDRRVQNALVLRGWRVLGVTWEDVRTRPDAIVPRFGPR